VRRSRQIVQRERKQVALTFLVPPHAGLPSDWLDAATNVERGQDLGPRVARVHSQRDVGNVQARVQVIDAVRDQIKQLQ
jgi:hypothetical protein